MIDIDQAKNIDELREVAGQSFAVSELLGVVAQVFKKDEGCQDGGKVQLTPRQRHVLSAAIAASVFVELDRTQERQ
ncbi:MAG: hypothetical protein Q4A28_10040 [Brachymonas sp.]|nr:hypothetical protein [Brachymonas sp.]